MGAGHSRNPDCDGAHVGSFHVESRFNPQYTPIGYLSIINIPNERAAELTGTKVHLA
ncbi:hypothetical protein MAHJHV61_12710 [Mycobacterium avium subsp. hominissuis]